MQKPTLNQVYTGIRYASGYIATGGAIVVMAGALPADTVHAIVNASQKVLTDLQQLIGDSALLVTLIFPIAMTVIAKLGLNSARPDSQKTAVVAAQPNTVVVETSSPAAAAKAASLIAAIPEVSKVVASAAIADAAPSDKVVAK
jgi:hypothetical protein